VPYIEVPNIIPGTLRIPVDDMWYLVCNQEFLVRLKQYLKRIFRRCIVVVFKVRNSARSRRSNDSYTEAVAVILPHLRCVIIGNSHIELHGAESCEPKRSSASQKIPGILWNPDVRYLIHKRSPYICILSQINPVRATQLY
jgi:hypothetical protein